MILTDAAILEAMKKGQIVITPFDISCLGSNSYDIHLSRHLAYYSGEVLDAKENNQVTRFTIPETGFVLMPGRLYLGSTVEYTETHNQVPYIEGKSSTGRLGIAIHATAGKGDVGFCNYWTLEISVLHPVKVYIGMPIGQLIYHTIEGNVLRPYDRKDDAKYTERSPLPTASKMFMNFLNEG